jgi:hypothetical protein
VGAYGMPGLPDADCPAVMYGWPWLPVGLKAAVGPNALPAVS